MSKRRTPGSGLNGADLLRDIYAVEELDKLYQEEEMEEALGEGVEASQGPAANVVSENITDLLATLGRKQRASCIIDFDILDEQLNISPGDPLVRQGNHADRVAESIARGGGVYMTSEEMYRHLDMLENLVPTTNETGARLWIDAIFFRVSAMLSDSNKRMVLNIEQHIPSVGISVPGQSRSLKISGTIDYAALATDPGKHESFMQSSQFQYVKQQDPNGLFVTEAKQEGVPLAQHVPQAVAEMYAAAKYLSKGILRGALTNGHGWIIYLNENGIGGTYTKSPTINIQVSDTYPYRAISPGPDIVAGILAYWMERSFVDLDENDWFSSPKMS